MGYKTIDPILHEWAEAHGLYLYKEYQEVAVRSVEDRSESPYRYQIWVDEPDQNGMVGVHVWDFKKNGRRCDLKVPRGELRNCLETALETAKSWSVTV